MVDAQRGTGVCGEKDVVAEFCDGLLKERDLTMLAFSTVEKIKQLAACAMRLAAQKDDLVHQHRSLEGRLNNMEINVKVSCENLRCAMRIADGYLEALKKERNAALDAILDTLYDSGFKDASAVRRIRELDFLLGAREQERAAARVAKANEVEVGDVEGAVQKGQPV